MLSPVPAGQHAAAHTREKASEKAGKRGGLGGWVGPHLQLSSGIEDSTRGHDLALVQHTQWGPQTACTHTAGKQSAHACRALLCSLGDAVLLLTDGSSSVACMKRCTFAAMAVAGSHTNRPQTQREKGINAR